MAVQGVVVKIEFGVQSAHAVIRGDYKGVDFHQRAVQSGEKLGNVGDELGGLAEQGTGQSQRHGDFESLERQDAQRRVNVFADNGFRAGGSHFFNVHAAFRTGHDNGAFPGAVLKNGEVAFLFEIHGFRHHDFADQLAGFPGLLGDQNLVKHLAGDFFHFLHGLDDVDASLKTVFEGAFTTAASVYLCLNYVLGEAHVPGCLCCFLSCGGGNALGGSHAKTLKELFCLIFVNVHDSGPFGQMFAEERLGLFLMSVKGEWFGLLIFCPEVP